MRAVEPPPKGAEERPSLVEMGKTYLHFLLYTFSQVLQQEIFSEKGLTFECQKYIIMTFKSEVIRCPQEPADQQTILNRIN